ncbi:MAG: group III truncated hemoglobin [Agriterribacter sp.]
MKKDIKTREDIELLVTSFYDKVKADDTIGYIFNDIAKVNWVKHLPVMFDFWENILFFTGGYAGNPMMIHQHLNKMFPLTKEHFKRWETLFLQTVDELFEGDKAVLAKQRALSISTVMQIKIVAS